MSTLILNASFEPHNIVPTRDAVVLLLEGKAHVVEPSGELYRSQFLAVEAPAVAVLQRYIKVPYRRIPCNARTVLARDGRRCGYCLGRATTIDHIIPRSRKGEHCFQNVVASCVPCNSKKDSSLLEELGWELQITPYQPRGLAGWLATVDKTDPRWQPYLRAS